MTKRTSGLIKMFAVIYNKVQKLGKKAQLKIYTYGPEFI